MKRVFLLLLNLMTLAASLKLFAQTADFDSYARAQETLKIIEKLYAVRDGNNLFRETYPYDDAYNASYLGGGADSNKSNPYAYLWPFSGSLSAYTALLEKSHDAGVRKHLDDFILPGLEQYYDKRQPAAYASYINSAPLSDRFYDDNIWLGIDFLDLYLHTKEKSYLDKANEIWDFVESGMDNKLGGGIYWCEQRKESKNTCSNAPAVVYLLKLYEATDSTHYLNKAKSLYEWTKNNLQDSSDRLYWDNINLSGKIDKTKYPYNTGQMIQAGALLYKLTKEQQYLQDAQKSALGGFTYFFDASKSKEKGLLYPLLKRSDNWFIAVMLRGYVELYHQDQNKQYVDVFNANLAHAWENMRDEDGLFGKDWLGNEETAIGKRWILDQFAIAEMYARLTRL
ncbi:alpha-1,6-mannanase [Sphingobacterium phlebotomi]|uniref:Alpha-1,6-mannanase n=2 Tax=Sphingobacterium phlebotomi TaxID=2605433 RepID=A0A5D4HDN2_9SPHI|nr:alpha-1,6-mannanase [Sphingobacterium phlebotomi]